MQQDQGSRTVVYYGIKFRNYKTDWIFLNIRKSSKILSRRAVLPVPTFHIKHLFPRVAKKPSRESRMQRNTREDMSIPRSFFDSQPARRVLEESYNHSKILAASSGIQKREGIQKSGSCQQCLYLVFRQKLEKKSLDDRNCLQPMTHHAAGAGTCAQSDMTIPSHPSSEMHLGKFSVHTEFQSLIANFRTEVCSKAKDPTRALQWIKEIVAVKSLDDLITLKSTTDKDFCDYEEVDLMMTSSLKRCYDKQTHFRKKISVERALRRKTDFPEGDKLLIWSMNIFDLLDPMMKLKDYRDYSVLNRRTTTLRMLIYVGSKYCYWQVILHRRKIWKGLYVFKFQDSSQAQSIMTLFNHEILRGGGKRNYHRLRNCEIANWTSSKK